MHEIALYFHWPFCRSKCPYCNFVSIPQEDTLLYDQFEHYLFLDLEKSISEIHHPIESIKSVFFGGGTPSLMSVKSIERILNFLAKNYYLKDDIEITIEANPATFDKKKIQGFKNAGINRLSLGVQSFFSENLAFLGRIYDGKQALESAHIVSEIFENFSFDFMYGYICQSKKSLERDLLLAMNDFGCKHLSCYQLTFEENTPFANMKERIDENQEVELYDFIENILDDKYIHYEVSNYAVSGFESKHNLAYWKYDDYLGIGASAHSRISFCDGEKTEMIKISDPFLWASALDRNQTTYSQKNILTEMEKLSEIIITGLRLAEGIAMNDLYQKVSPQLVNRIISWEKLRFLCEKKLIQVQEVSDDSALSGFALESDSKKWSKQRLQLTKSGMRKMNSIVEFLLL